MPIPIVCSLKENLTKFSLSVQNIPLGQGQSSSKYSYCIRPWKIPCYLQHTGIHGTDLNLDALRSAGCHTEGVTMMDTFFT